MSDKFFWEKYLSIEKDFIDAKRYVDFVPANYNVSSDFFSNEIILIGSLIESSLKHLANLRDPGCSVGNFGEIKGQILTQFPKIVLAETHLNGTEKVFSPFSGWNDGPLDWWESYTDIKHGKLEKASLKLSLVMLSAFEIVLFLIHSEQVRIGEISNPDRNRTFVYYSFSEMPSLIIPNFTYTQQMGSGNFYFLYPISKYEGK